MLNVHNPLLAETDQMANKSDKISQRIATIASAKPVSTGAPPSKPGSNRNDQRRAVYRHGRLTVAGGVKM
ncbi:MAG: hypothetical protein AAB227_02540 [Pseudomonadota bacterium]